MMGVYRLCDYLLYSKLHKLDHNQYARLYVSAFNNAGFSTFSDNLMGFRGNVWVNLVISLLIILGGEFMALMWHHWEAWIIIVFAILHVYFVIREEMIKRNGELPNGATCAP